MFGLGFSEILLILIVALLVFGPERLPEIARTLGKASAELRRALDDLKYEVTYQDSDIRRSRRSPGAEQPSGEGDKLPAVPVATAADTTTANHVQERLEGESSGHE